MTGVAERAATEYRSIAEIEWTEMSESRMAAHFETRGMPVLVSFEAAGRGEWELVFEVGPVDATHAVHAAFDILNGVLQAASDFLARRRPAALVLVAESVDQAYVYEVYLRREAYALFRLGYSVEGLRITCIEPY
jgi:hypothetical protein